MNGRVQLHLCINDPANGSPSGRIVGLHVYDGGDAALELEANDPGPVCLVEDHRNQLRIGPHRYGLEAHHTWVGNWCWDSVTVTPETAAELLNHARASGWWSLDAGLTSWFDRWNAGEPFTAAWLTDATARLAVT